MDEPIFHCRYIYLFLIFPITKQITNVIASNKTIVAPTGVDIKIDTRIPIKALITPITTEKIMTFLYREVILIADNDGKINNAVTNKEPTKLIAITMIKEIDAAIIISYI